MADGNAALMEIEGADVDAPASRPGETRALATLSGSAGAMLGLIEKIITNPNLPIERVNQAFDFYQRVEKAAAKKEFDAAMAAAKAEFEPIVKRHMVDQGVGKANYKHEDLADISDAVTPALSKNGLSYRYRASSEVNQPIKVTCIVTHAAGYSEETELHAGRDDSGGKNAIHAMGSTLTYLQRYTLRLALGLAAGRDNDGKGAAPAPISEEQREQLQTLIVDANADIRRLCEWLNVERINDIPATRYQEVVDKLEEKRKREQ